MREWQGAGDCWQLDCRLFGQIEDGIWKKADALIRNKRMASGRYLKFLLMVGRRAGRVKYLVCHRSSTSGVEPDKAPLPSSTRRSIVIMSTGAHPKGTAHMANRVDRVGLFARPLEHWSMGAGHWAFAFGFPKSGPRPYLGVNAQPWRASKHGPLP